MIIEKQTNAIIQEEGETRDSIGMSLDLDSAQILMQMLSKNLYSDAIGSTIRECASNALDSHRRAGVTKPIIVSFKPNERDNYEFSVEDFGIGLDADDVKNIISKYGKSTKRNSDTELGMMGLGFKAPLAYSSSFYFICRKDGVERKYMMYEGEDTNTIDLLYEKDTTEGNGVKVIVPTKHYDKESFKEKIREQLAYFQNVYFDCGNLIDNNFVIYRTDLFQFSQLATDRNLHLCLDDVYYPIDFQKLGIDKIDFPIAIRLGLTDGVFPTPNRESIRYTKEAKDIILNKIKNIADYFIDKYNESIRETDDVFQVMKYYLDDSKCITLGTLKKDISSFTQHSTKSLNQPKLKGVNILKMKDINRIKDYIFSEYQVKYMIENKRWKEVKHQYFSDLNFRDVITSEPKKYFIYSNKISGKMKDYLKETYGHNSSWSNRIRILKKIKDFKLGKVGEVDYNTYCSLLSLNKIPKEHWRTAIKEFQYILNLIVKSFINIDDIEIPNEWLDSRKKVSVLSSGGKAQRKVKLKGDIIGKQAERLERWVDGRNCKWVSTTYKLQDIHKEKAFVIYGGADDVEIMDKLFKIVDFSKCGTKLKFVQFSERELKNINNIKIHNWIKLKTFMEGKNKPFKRLVTAHLISNLIKKNEDVFTRKYHLRDISESLFTKLEQLSTYEKQHSCYAEEKIYEAMLEVAEANNLFDHSIYYIYKDVKNICEKLTFLQPVCSKLTSYSTDVNKEMINVISDLFKYYRQRMDWKNYNITLTEDDLLEKPLTEETVNELVEN